MTSKWDYLVWFFLLWLIWLLFRIYSHGLLSGRFLNFGSNGPLRLLPSLQRSSSQHPTRIHCDSFPLFPKHLCDDRWVLQASRFLQPRVNILRPFSRRSKVIHEYPWKNHINFQYQLNGWHIWAKLKLTPISGQGTSSWQSDGDPTELQE